MYQRTHYAVDCEYDSKTRRLLSIALAPITRMVDARYELTPLSFYAVQGPIPKAGEVDPWVMEHVVPLLSPNEEVDRTTLVGLLERFLDTNHVTDLWFDWPDDIAYLCDLMITGPGERIEMPSMFRPGQDGFRMHYIAALDEEHFPSTVPHHALHDAKALARAFEQTEQYRYEVRAERAMANRR